MSVCVTYDAAKAYIKNNRREFQIALDALTTRLDEVHSTNNLPIYSTKSRIKQAESVFLKTKRDKSSTLKEITDYAGLRILCLFKQDLLPIHVALMIIYNEQKYDLREFILYNWGNETGNNKLIDEDKLLIETIIGESIKYFPSTKPVQKIKLSGYKSLHYLINIKISETTCPVEVQLRTVLQDAWGELEHSLSYKKGNIHPHIKKSFLLLSKDLDTNDFLVSHLKNVAEKEQFGALYSIKKSGPHKWFDYEPDLLPDKLKQPANVPLWNAYLSLVYQQEDQRQSSEEWQKAARECYDNISNLFTAKELAKDNKIKYLIEMEDAWLHFCEGHHSTALDIYINSLSKVKEQYILYFRIGELYFVQDKIVRALDAFDKCEELIIRNKKKSILCGYENVYRIKVKLANIYWMLGSQYLHLSLEQIKEAERLYAEHKELFTTKDYNSLINNLCCYNLEYYINREFKQDEQDERDKQYDTVKAYFSKLKESVAAGNNSSNCLDTLAWCCYQFFLNERNREYLAEAKDYCNRMDERFNEATFLFTSYSIHINHIQEIMSTQ